jgi:hypothetical protein
MKGLLLPALILVGAVCAVPALAQLQVGEHYPVYIDAARDYPGSPDGSLRLAWEEEIQHPGATYIAIHFTDFRLASGDYLEISDPVGGQAYRLSDRGKMNAGEFWARHVKGDSALLRLYTSNKSGAQGFVIDEIAAGFEELGTVDPEAICGLDDKENAVCYETTYPVEYDRARAVARLLINGSSLCTGWLVSSSDHLITNNHCIGSSSSALNTDYEFMAEAPSCGSSNCQLCYPGDVYSGATFVQTSSNLDYTLVQINSGSPAAQYGYLQIDDRDAVVGERIYIPQHPGGRAKELAIESTASADTDGLCHVYSVTSAPCTGSGYYDVGYYCDTEGGSSGSPVLAASSDKVVALHHCANCPNRGVPIDLVWAQISDLIGPECGVNEDCDDGLFCNGAESCVDGACQDGTPPCEAGEDCDEDLDQCVPHVCDNDGTCEAGEDCTTCSADCISGSSSASCGNTVCEIGAGEDCVSCPADCNGVTTGKPSGRYCCGADIDCSDGRCTGGGNTCSATGGSGQSYCCGDGTCEGDEDSFNCELDCGPAFVCGDGTCNSTGGETPCNCPGDCGPAGSESPYVSCTDGVDNDCDGAIDCDDADCASDQSCSCSVRGVICSTDEECCSNRCHRGVCK